MRSPEQTKSWQTKVVATAAGFITAATAGFLGYAIGHGSSEGSAAGALYRQEYAIEGKCLHDTPYDTTMGAIAVSRTFKLSNGEETILTILPDQLPSVPSEEGPPAPESLYFTYGKGQLAIADQNITGVYLASQHCPLPTGS